MTELRIEISIESIAGMINGMDENEVETLCVLLNSQGQEVLKRKEQIDSGKVRLLSRDEAFDV